MTHQLESKSLRYLCGRVCCLKHAVLEGKLDRFACVSVSVQCAGVRNEIESLRGAPRAEATNALQSLTVQSEPHIPSGTQPN